jgi:hypothetical protein
MPHLRSPKKLEERLRIGVNYNRNLDKFLLLYPQYKIRTWIEANKYSDYLTRNVISIMGYCVLCGYSNKDALEVHHIDSNHHNNHWIT